ncbi:MAG TPA: phosphoenolpyruvate--protein phosphotransferase [Bryobacteraceae bacterium]|nr:phosphoenolpyruvate--protein phosphotransferase [Bryobacteraceae bacterium]
MPESLEFAFECSLANGLHVRPASHLSEIANRFASAVRLTNLRTGAGADLKSVLATVAADVRPGDRYSVTIDGPDQEPAGAELRRFIDQDLAACDGPLTEAAPPGERKLPRVLVSSGANCFAGVAASKGVGVGKVAILAGPGEFPDFASAPAGGVVAEKALVEDGFAGLRRRIQDMLIRHPAGVEGSILEAHLAMIDDAAMHAEIDRRIAAGDAAGRAVTEAARHFTALLAQAGSAAIRDRAADVQELCGELLREMYGAQMGVPHAELREATILVAQTLAPQQLLGLRREHLKGIVLETAGATSHAVILARSFAVPVVVGIAGARGVLQPCEEAVVDGTRGIVVSPATPAVRRFYQLEDAANRRRDTDLARIAAAPAATADGRSIAVGANILHPDELAPAFRNGADGIGLLRTEFLFLDRRQPPSEEEQYAIYSRAVREAAGKPVILRTLDAGADKPLPYVPLPPEKNPFLGRRGIRLYAGYRDLMMAQLRAALRASADGPVWLMAPMISLVEEARWFREQVGGAKQELRAQSVRFDEAIRVGAMIEVPSTAFLLPHLAAELDFFSIGTNDLCQYFFAVDRENSDLARLAQVRSPGFLALLEQIAAGLRARGRWVGMCGEMAGDPRNLPLLAGLGLDEISVPVNEIAGFKKRIANLSAERCRTLLDHAVRCGTTEEVERLLDDAGFGGSEKPLLDSALIQLDSESRGKEEVISELVNALYAAGYTDDRGALEEALWARESVYPTGVGHGFAIPHCKSKAVLANGIAMVRLRQPIEWGSLDHRPVGVVVLFAVRESTGQNFPMKLFAQLARKLMDEKFRDLLTGAQSPVELARQVAQELAG